MLDRVTCCYLDSLRGLADHKNASPLTWSQRIQVGLNQYINILWMPLVSQHLVAEFIKYSRVNGYIHECAHRWLVWLKEM